MRFATAVMWIGIAFIAAVLIIVLITMAWPAQAHDWYAKACCGDNDCHPTPCERITAVGGGFEYRDYNGAVYFFTRDKMKFSQDGECHACVHQESHSALCLYLPVSTWIPRWTLPLF